MILTYTYCIIVLTYISHIFSWWNQYVLFCQYGDEQFSIYSGIGDLVHMCTDVYVFRFIYLEQGDPSPYSSEIDYYGFNATMQTILLEVSGAQGGLFQDA